jgi:formamidase
MPDVVFSFDQARSMRDRAVASHNRWHSDIPPAANVCPGQQVRVQCREWTAAAVSTLLLVVRFPIAQ